MIVSRWIFSAVMRTRRPSRDRSRTNALYSIFTWRSLVRRLARSRKLITYPFDLRPHHGATALAQSTTNELRLRFRLVACNFHRLFAPLFLRELTAPRPVLYPSRLLRGESSDARKAVGCPLCRNTRSSRTSSS